MVQRIRLTGRSAAKLSVERTEYTVWDTRMAGLGVRVRPSGYRTWIFHLPTYDSEYFRCNFGVHFNCLFCFSPR